MQRLVIQVAVLGLVAVCAMPSIAAVKLTVENEAAALGEASFLVHRDDADIVCLAALRRFEPLDGAKAWYQTEAMLRGSAELCEPELDWPVLARAAGDQDVKVASAIATESKTPVTKNQIMLFGQDKRGKSTYLSNGRWPGGKSDATRKTEVATYASFTVKQSGSSRATVAELRGGELQPNGGGNAAQGLHSQTRALPLGGLRP